MVSQFLRPDADQSDGSWLNEAASNTNLFASVDETSLSDTDFMQSSVTDGDKVRLRLSDPTSGVVAPLIVRYRCKRTGAQAANLIGRLFQGTSPGTQIATWTQLALSETFTTYTYTLTSGEFASITDFTDLYVEFELSQQASLKVDLNFAAGVYYDSGTVSDATGILSCSRASTGYAKNADGTLTSFASNALRIGVGTGLLVEDARTNLVLQSEDFSTTWTTSNTNVTVNQAVSPAGTTTMDKVDDGVAAGRHAIYQLNAGYTAGANATFSIFLKDVDRQYVQVTLQGASAGVLYCYADLQAGTITDSGVASGAAGISFTSASIEAFANSTYRVTLVGIVNNVDTSVYCMVCLSDRSTQGGSLAFGSPSYTGTSKSVLVWGGQSEVATFPSSYIPTTGTSATRAADLATCIGNANTLLSATTISLVMDLFTYRTAAQVANGDRIIIGTGGILPGNGFTPDTSAFTSIGGTIVSFNPTSFAGNGVKIGYAQAPGAESITGAGVTPATGAVPLGTTMTNATLLGQSGGNPYFWGYARRLTLWNSKLPDATLQAFTR